MWIFHPFYIYSHHQWHRITNSLSHVWFNIYQMRRAVTNCILLKCHASACLVLEDLLYKHCPDTTLQASHTMTVWCYKLSCHGVQVVQVYCTRSQCFKQSQQHPLSQLWFLFKSICNVYPLVVSVTEFPTTENMPVDSRPLFRLEGWRCLVGSAPSRSRSLCIKRKTIYGQKNCF